MMADLMNLNGRIALIKGDITKVKADVIVNAANSSLLGGGGVDGAIHKAAGRELFEACKLLDGCNTGEVKHTKAYKLNANFVFHAVGPIWQGGIKGEHELLAKCYKNCFLLSKNLQIETIAFPAISTGVYRFPKDEAVDIALTETIFALKQNAVLKKVIFVIFDDENYIKYANLMGLNQ